jgi:seryl-tRNA(Sec) selenium transferase
VGTEQLVTAARAHGAPHQRLARAMKVGKEEIGGLIAAVRRYVALDHAEERDRWYATVEAWRAAFEDLPGISPEIEHRNEAGQPVPRLRLEVDPAAAAVTASELVERLRAGRPRIEVLPGGRDAFWISPDLIDEPEALAVSTAISTAVGGRPRAEG